jgi:thiosulfate/3-mercaptopyruvate sulfurtransferase
LITSAPAAGSACTRANKLSESTEYCQSAWRASETAAVLRDLGFSQVKMYESSWLGYAGVLSAPAGDEVFVNVGALNGRISSLQNRVRTLEGEVIRLQKVPPALPVPACGTNC